MRIARIGLVLVALAAALTGLLQLPVDVPDTNSPPEGNHSGVVNAANTVGQTLTVNRNGLDRIDVTLGVEEPDDHADVAFRIQQMPWKESREVTRNVLSLPVGNVEDFRPATITQHWYSFQFEPITDSGGKQFFFTLEGKTLDGPHSLGLLMFFHNQYPLGEAYINGNPTDAHVVFRAYTRGRLSDLIAVLAENAAADQAGLAGYPFFYLLVGLAYAVVGTASVLMIRRAS